METKIIARVNNVDIISTSDEQMVPIRPICEALSIDADSQRQRIERDEMLSSVAVMMTATGRDGKHYEMFAIPYRYIFGWLFSIDASRVSEAARPAVLQYKQKCYDVLFEHFTEPQTFLAQKQEIIERQVNEYQECQRRFRDAQKLMNEAKAELNRAMSVTIDEWRMNNRQMILPFKENEGDI